MQNREIKISRNNKSERGRNLKTARCRFRCFLLYLINIIHSLSFSHVQPCFSLFQPCFSIKSALPPHGLGFFSASSQPLKYIINKERFSKRLMIIAKFYSVSGRWGEFPRYTGKSPPWCRNISEKSINSSKNEKQ